MGKAFEVNKRNMDRFQRELQKEFEKRPVRVPIQVNPEGAVLPSAATVNNYHGPIVTVTGDNAQLAWDNETVSQNQSRVEQIAPGYEALAGLVTDLLANLDTFGLAADDAEDLRSSAGAVLGEVVKEEPDRSIVRRGVTMIAGVLGMMKAGAATGVTQESAEAARQLIESLGNSLPF